jgi:hypothetical protein
MIFEVNTVGRWAKPWDFAYEDASKYLYIFSAYFTAGLPYLDRRFTRNYTVKDIYRIAVEFATVAELWTLHVHYGDNTAGFY